MVFIYLGFVQTRLDWACENNKERTNTVLLQKWVAQLHSSSQHWFQSQDLTFYYSHALLKLFVVEKLTQQEASTIHTRFLSATNNNKERLCSYIIMYDTHQPPCLCWFVFCVGILFHTVSPNKFTAILFHSPCVYLGWVLV